MDCFAHVNNTQLPTFYSRFWCLGSAAIDAFTVRQLGWQCKLVGPAHPFDCLGLKACRDLQCYG